MVVDEARQQVAQQSHLGVVERRGRGDGDGLVPRGEHRPAVGAALRDPERFARAKAQQHGLVVESASRPLRKPEARLGHGLGRGRPSGRLSLRGRAFLVVEVAVLQSHEPHVRVVVGRLQPMGAVAVGPRGEAAPGDDPWVQPSLLEEKLAGAVAEPRVLEEACVAGRVEGFVSFLPGPWPREGQRVDPHASVQPSAGLGEGHPQPPHHEVDGAAPRPAGEATEGVAARVERQARAVVVVEGAEALVALDVEPHPLRHLLYGQVVEPLEGQSVEHGRRFLRETGMPVRYSSVLV